MSDYVIDGNDKIYNVWDADKTTPIFKNEMLRNLNIFYLMQSVGSFKTVIDIGSGTGYLDYLLAKNGYSIMSVDLSSKRLSLFSDIARNYNITQINKNLFDLEEKNFDFVISQEVLEHLDDYESALRKMNTFIRKDGFGLFCVPYNENLEAKMVTDPNSGKRYHKVGHLHSFTKEKLSRSIKNSGFEVIKIKLIVNKRSFKHFAKLKIPVNNFTIKIDEILNNLYPKKAAYLSILCRKK